MDVLTTCPDRMADRLKRENKDTATKDKLKHNTAKKNKQTRRLVMFLDGREMTVRRKSMKQTKFYSLKKQKKREEEEKQTKSLGKWATKRRKKIQTRLLLSGTIRCRGLIDLFSDCCFTLLTLNLRNITG